MSAATQKARDQVQTLPSSTQRNHVARSSEYPRAQTHPDLHTHPRVTRSLTKPSRLSPHRPLRHQPSLSLKKNKTTKLVYLAAPGLSCGMRTQLRCVGSPNSSLSRDGTQAPAMGAWSLSHWASRKALVLPFSPRKMLVRLPPLIICQHPLFLDKQQHQCGFEGKPRVSSNTSNFKLSYS